jgi:SAM-dependent methyltransferase
LCGVGHTSAILASLCPGLEIVAADSDFVNLFLARHLTAPGVTALCVDAGFPLPFADAAVDGLFCLDGLHYVRSKVALLREIDRIVSTEGFWLFAHMHNALSANMNPGVPLSPEGYAKRFFFGQQRLLSETEILRQFQAGGFLDLTEQSTLDTIASHNALTLIGARTDLLWTRHLGVDDALCRRPDLLAFNPLYRVEGSTDELLLRAMWPSDTLRRECTGTIPLPPESVRVPLRIVEEISMARSGGLLSADVRRLVRSAVLVSLPQCYPRLDLPLYAVMDQQA